MECRAWVERRRRAAPGTPGDERRASFVLIAIFPLDRDWAVLKVTCVSLPKIGPYMLSSPV